MAKNSALPLVAGGAALLLLGGKKKSKKKKSSSSNVRWGVRVSKDCQKVEIVDPAYFDNFLRGAYEELIEIDSSLTLIQISDALFGEVAPNCSGFPETPESAEVAELYAVIARAVGAQLVQDPRTKDSIGSLVDEATQISFTDWYRAWRNYPSPETPSAPSGQVVFSSDLTTYKIGDSWYEEIVVPFVRAAKSEGRIDVAFQDFVEKAGVQVGQFVVPINELPQDSAAVEAFLSDLETAIQTAKQEA